MKFFNVKLELNRFISFWNKEQLFFRESVLSPFFHFETQLLMRKIKQSEHQFLCPILLGLIPFFFYWLHLRSSPRKPVEVIEKYWQGLEYTYRNNVSVTSLNLSFQTAVLARHYETVIFATVDLWILLYILYMWDVYKTASQCTVGRKD